MEKEVGVTTGQVLVEMHVTNGSQPQREDPELAAVLCWLEAKKDWSEDTPGGACFQWGWPNGMEELSKFHGPPRCLYLSSMPKGENEDLLLFIVPKAHQTPTLNRCHQGAGHQGHDHTLSLLQECFWWPGMAKQMRQTIRACTHCLQYEGVLPKAPLCPIVATAPLDLLHVDFTSIENMLEPNEMPRVANILVSKTTSQTCVGICNPWSNCKKPLLNFYMGGYISIFGVLARLLSDRGASFTCNVIEELCKLLGVKWLWTTPYQTNGLVERLHQMILHMIGKLGEAQKANWLSHLAE